MTAAPRAPEEVPLEDAAPRAPEPIVPRQVDTPPLDRWRDAMHLTYLLCALVGLALAGGLALLVLGSFRSDPADQLRDDLRAVMALRAGMPEPSRLDALVQMMRTHSDRAWQPDPGQRQAAQTTHAQLLAILPPQDLRRSALEPCLELAAAPGGGAKSAGVPACLIVLEGFQRQIISLPDAETLRQTVELRKLDIEDRRSAMTSGTQFVLAVLGLFVPILTSLLGYMFGARSLRE